MSQVSVNIPAGVEDGNRLRVAGKGEGGERGGPVGDLYIFLHVLEHEFFQRRGNDLLAELPVNFCQASLGAEVEVPTLEGKTTVRIPKGTQVGQSIKISGQGVPHIQGYGRGDLIFFVNVAIPKKLNKRQEELLREFIACSPENGRAAKKGKQKESWLDRIRDIALG